MHLFHIKNISKHFPSQDIGAKSQWALNNVNFVIEKGEILGIVGKSGAGKSTLIRCLIGLEKPTQGEIFFHDNDIVTFNDKQLTGYRKNIGMVFQNYHLFPSKTIAENIAFPMEVQGVDKETINSKITELLILVGLENKRNSYPLQLSGGEKQRVAIARALANDPEVLFCDEPTSALDPSSTHSILALLKDLNSKLGLTIIIITHQWEVVKSLCSKVAVLATGELVEHDSVLDIVDDKRELSHLVERKNNVTIGESL